MACFIKEISSLKAPRAILQKLHNRARNWPVAWSWSAPKTFPGNGPLRHIAHNPVCTFSRRSYSSCVQPVPRSRLYRTAVRDWCLGRHLSQRSLHRPLWAHFKSVGQSLHVRTREWFIIKGLSARHTEIQHARCLMESFRMEVPDCHSLKRSAISAPVNRLRFGMNPFLRFGRSLCYDFYSHCGNPLDRFAFWSGPFRSLPLLSGPFVL